MLQYDLIPCAPDLDYDGWIEALRGEWGRYCPKADEPKAFVGRARPRNVYGFVAMDVGCNAHMVDRTQQDIRFDGVDHYYTVFQIAGESLMKQNDQAVSLAVGDAALVDSARPVTYISDSESGHWFSLQLPRHSLVSHLGFDPQGGTLSRSGTLAGRLLLDIIRDCEGAKLDHECHMQLAIYDLIGALFAPSEPALVSLHSEKMFRRVCAVIRDGFVDPDFGPCDVAADLGISLRYVQKLFTERGAVCSEFIYAQRLDHAAQLLCRREFLRTGQPLSEIAYACGFRDYTHFSRRFRQRFGHSPGAHFAENIHAIVGSKN
jgi:AraC family transcriptional activator of tynA and feaB